MTEDQRHDLENNLSEILESMTAEDLELREPPPGLWKSIESQLGAGPPAKGGNSATGSHPTGDVSAAPVVDIRSRRRKALRVAAAAAAVVVIVGAAITLSADDAGGPIEVANATLEFDPAAFDPSGEGATALATLLDSDEAQSLRLDPVALPEPEDGADLELWLIGIDGADIQVIQTLGLIENTSEPGVFMVPADFDPDLYDTVAVDISIEPHDGDAAHSGRSIVRGALIAT